MGGASYNGYSWNQRALILRAFHRGEAGPDFRLAGKPCGLCNDPDRSATEWHSEDYSQPFKFEPPQTYPICKPCHLRLHKRFNQSAAEWELFCRHVEAGGYGSEFVAAYPVRVRSELCKLVEAGEPITIQEVRCRSFADKWWRRLTLDPESIEAPWARPRPLRERPSAEEYAKALQFAELTDVELKFLKFHAEAERRTVTMRQVAMEGLGNASPQAANLQYGRLAKRIGHNLNWEPDTRANGTPFWMSVIAEGWQPPPLRGVRRDYELTMVPVLADHVRGSTAT